jgi:hypothetical protein
MEGPVAVGCMYIVQVNAYCGVYSLPVRNIYFNFRYVSLENPSKKQKV